MEGTLGSCVVVDFCQSVNIHMKPPGVISTQVRKCTYISKRHLQCSSILAEGLWLLSFKVQCFLHQNIHKIQFLEVKFFYCRLQQAYRESHVLYQCFDASWLALVFLVTELLQASSSLSYKKSVETYFSFL